MPFYAQGNASYGKPVNPLQLATLQNQSGGGYGSGSSEIPNMPMPDWLTTNPDDLMGEIMGEFKNTGQYFNTSGINKAYNQSIDTAMGMGGQVADNAMREGMARAGQEGGSANSAMMKAQAMLPVYEHTAGLRKDKALAISDVRTREAGMRAQLAQSIGQMRSSYLAHLGDVYMKGQGMSMAWQGQQFNQGLMARQQALQEDQIDYSRRKAESASSGVVTPFKGQMTRMPNNAGGGAGMEYTPEFNEYLKASGQTAPTLQNYPSTRGIGSGADLDAYNKQMRTVASLASQQPAYNMANPASGFGANVASMGSGGFGRPADYDPFERVRVGDKMVPAYHGKPIVRAA